MGDLQDYWREMIARDLEGFADPRSHVLVDASGAVVTAMWSQRGHDRTASFQLSQDGDFRWVATPGAEPRPYRHFLSSDGLADFGQLAQAISRVFPAPKHYVPTKASVESNGASPPRLASDVLLLDKCTSALQSPVGKTQLLFIKGDAGSGKTTLLHHVTRTQAEQYRRGSSPFLFLYVSAQGRALSNLRDALSGELDDLRAGFTRDGVPPLARQGLIVPIIDGFDELLGAAGYGDAFGSLHQFLEELGGHGVIVVSARSSFYDVEFLGRDLTEPNRGSAYDIAPVTLCPWGDEELFSYIAQARGRGEIGPADKEAVAKLPPADRELLAKPFFASLFPDYVDSPQGKSRGVSLSDYLVESYVRRESGKIVDRDGRPLLDADGHRRIFVLTAEFMWTGEKRDFSADDLRAVAELVAESVGLAGDSARQLVTKITSYAGFRTSKQGRDQRFSFEHEVYFDHFLSEALHTRMSSPPELSTFLDGGFLPEEVIAAAVSGENASAWLDSLGSFRRVGPLDENRRRNAGTLAAACFRAVKSVKNRVVQSCHFVNTSFGDAEFDSVEFRDCRFAAVRLEAAKFRGCRALDCAAESLVVSRGTQFGVAGLTPGRNLFRVVNLDSGEEIFSPTDMRQLLHSIAMPDLRGEPDIGYTKNASRLIHLLQRVVQKYRQSNLLCLEDELLFAIFRDPDWQTLLNLLIDHEIVGQETRQTSGSRKTFLRCRVDLADLMRLEREYDLPSDHLGDFWRTVRGM